jgi:hypothetical protein
MVCLCGRFISDRLDSLLEHDLRTLPYRNWESIPVHTLYDEISWYNTFCSMIKLLRLPEARDAVQLLRSRFAGFLDNVILQPYDEELADFLTAEGVLLRPGAALHYRMASPLIDGLIRAQVIPFQFPNAPSAVPPCGSNQAGLLVLDTLIESLKFFDKDLIRLASFLSYKSSTVRVRGLSHIPVPRESAYAIELMRILSSWLFRGYGWTVTGQWHLRTAIWKHKHTDIILQKDDRPPIVLKLLATGDPDFVKSHIEKTPEYMALLSADEGWVVHFTCEDDYDPIWQSDVELDKGVNVVHFSHGLDFTRLQMWACWKKDGIKIFSNSCYLDI